MRSFLPTFIIISLVANPILSQMKYFDSIIYCAKSLKELAKNVNNLGQSSDDPFAVISQTSILLRDMPDLLDNCGKQKSAKIYRYVLSTQCINLHQLQASFTVKIVKLKGLEKPQNDLLIDFYSKLIDKINKKESQVCKFFNLQLADILSPLEGSECIKQGQTLINSLKQEVGDLNEARIEIASILLNAPLLLERTFSFGKICINEYNQYFPLPCLGELAKAVKMVSTMKEYSTVASWLWDHIRQLKSSIQAIKTECPKLILLLI